MKDLSDMASSLTLGTLPTFIQQSREEVITDVVYDNLPAICTLDDLFKKATVEPPLLVEGLLHKGTKMVLGGDSKACKSWSLLDLGLSVAAGVPWWDLKTTKASVLYVNLELPDWALQQRLRCLLQKKPECVANERIFDVWNLRGHARGLPELVPSIIQRANTKYGLIILDPIYKLYGDADENSAGDMALILNAMDTLIEKTGAAVVFAAHFSKGNKSNKQAMDRISGSGVFARDPDTIITLTPHENENTLVVESSVRCIKRLEPFCVQWQSPLLVRDRSADPRRLKRVGGPTAKFSTDQLLQQLGADNLTSTEWKARCMEHCKMSDRKFHDLLKQLKEEEKIILNAEKRYSFIQLSE